MALSCTGAPARPAVGVLDPGDPRAAALAGQLAAPAWAAADPGWTRRVLTWTAPGGRPVAAALVLCRRVPGSDRFLAVLSSAPVPVGDRDGAPPEDLGAWLPAATAALRREGAFAVRVTGGAGAPA